MSNCKPWKVTSIHFQLSKNTQLKGNIHRVYLKPTGIFQVLLKLWIATKGPNLYWLYIPFSWEKRKLFFFFFFPSIEMLKITMKEISPNLPFPTHILFPFVFHTISVSIIQCPTKKGKNIAGGEWVHQEGNGACEQTTDQVLKHPDVTTWL